MCKTSKQKHKVEKMNWLGYTFAYSLVFVFNWLTFKKSMWVFKNVWVFFKKLIRSSKAEFPLSYSGQKEWMPSYVMTIYIIYHIIEVDIFQ